MNQRENSNTASSQQLIEASECGCVNYSSIQKFSQRNIENHVCQEAERNEIFHTLYNRL